MFQAIFRAMMRVVNQTLVPALISIGVFMMELMLDGLSWLIVKVADMIAISLGWVLNLFPIPPDLSLTSIPYGTEIVSVLTLAGFWDALTVFLIGSLIVLLIRVMTLGVIGK